MQKSSSLSKDWEGEDYHLNKEVPNGWDTYTLLLQPTDFMLFGSGFGSKDADMTYVREPYVKWDGKHGRICDDLEQVILVPASSVKGAISHRTAFYFNGKNEHFADKLVGKFDDYTGKNNPAISAIFGSEGIKDNRGKTIDKKRGKALFSDVIQTKHQKTSPQVIPHVAIDRFTGGAIDGALFQEETMYAQKENIHITIRVHESAFKGEYGDDIRSSFEMALKDVCRGLLSLGGGVNRGNGSFKGKLVKNGEVIYG